MASSAARTFRPGRRGLLLLLLALPPLLATQPIEAHPSPPSASAYTVSLEDPGGTPLRTFRWSGGNFVLGQVGERFNVRLTNQTSRRVEAVLTIDGRDAVSGAMGDYTRQRGYLLPPYGSVVVEGFRQSLSVVAAFC